MTSILNKIIRGIKFTLHRALSQLKVSVNRISHVFLGTKLVNKIYNHTLGRIILLCLAIVTVIAMLFGVLTIIGKTRVERRTDHLELARAAIDKNDFSLAEQEFIKALERNDNKQTWRELAYAYQQQKKKDEAISAYERSITNSDTDASTYNMLGNLYRDKTNYPKAEEAYLKAISLTPSMIVAVTNLGHLYTIEQKYDNCIELYKKYYDGTKAKSKVGLQLASLYLNLNKPNEAKQIINQILKVDPDNKSAQALNR